MTNKKLNRKLKKNKYRIIFLLIAILASFIIITSVVKKSKEAEIARYDNEILIVKANGDQLDSLTLKELRKLGAENKTISINNGLEKVSIEGVAIEKIIGKLNYNLRDRSAIIIEDNEGKSKKLSMSVALEPDRVFLVYKINDTPIHDLASSYGKMAIIDINSTSSEDWFTNVKTIDIQ